MRKIALYSDLDSNFNIDANVWFKQITEKINILKKIEDYISQSLSDTIGAEMHNASQNMIIFGLLSAFGVALTAIKVVVIIPLIPRPIRISVSCSTKIDLTFFAIFVILGTFMINSFQI